MWAAIKANPWRYVIIAVVILALILVGFYGWRARARLAEADKREKARMAEIQARDDENNRLRGENAQIRKDIAELSANNEALEAIIKEHGGLIANEQKKLDQINESLKNDQAVIAAPTDRCTRCQRFSAAALAARLIDKPLTCREECPGAP